MSDSTVKPPFPRPGADAFEVFELPRCYGLDAAELERRFLAKSRQFHPDLQGQDPSRKAHAVLATAALNEAYGILKDDHRRADALLTLRGGPTAADERAVDPAFLEELLELRLAIDEAAGDDAATAALDARFVSERDRALASVGNVLEALDETPSAEALREARRGLNQAAYWRTLLRDLRDG